MGVQTKTKSIPREGTNKTRVQYKSTGVRGYKTPVQYESKGVLGKAYLYPLG